MIHPLAFTLYSLLLAYLPRVIVALVIMGAFWGVAVITQKLLLKYLNHHHSRQALLELLTKSIRIIIIFIGIITGLASLGINIAAMVASLGLVGFALSFALKETLSNTISGFMVLFHQPFKLGDTISIDKIEQAKVTHINLRYTQLIKGTHTYLVPNAKLIHYVIDITQPNELSNNTCAPEPRVCGDAD